MLTDILRISGKNMKEQDKLSAEGIQKNLNGNKYNIIFLDEVDSTNRYLKSAGNDLVEYTAVIADSQTCGRGRFTRKFYSPAGSGIYMSILLKPGYRADDSVLITAASAVAVADAIKEVSGSEPSIKWVNDVFINSKKVCGILCEGVLNTETSQLDRVILGIGINVYPPENGFDGEISSVAGSVFEKPQPGMRNRLAACVLDRFKEYYTQLESRTFLEKYRSYSAVTGERITVLKGGRSLEAKALDIDENCRLLVEYSDKSREYLSSGEISIRLVPQRN